MAKVRYNQVHTPAQAWDTKLDTVVGLGLGDLAALDALSGTGGAYRIAADTWALRTLVDAGDGRTVVTNGDGVAGNPTIDVVESNLIHANLGTLGWSSSGHTGTASRLAGFDGSGAASYYQIGVDVQAYDADLTGLAGLGDGVPCRVAGTWTNKTGGADNQLARWDGTTALQGSVWTVADSTGALSASVASTSITNTDGDLALTAGDGTLTLTGTEGVHIASALTLASDLPITEGGTGASTAANARTNLGVLQGMIAKIPSNVTMTNATLASSGLSLTIGAGETWMFMMTFESNVNATDNLKYQLQTTGTAFAGYGGTQNAAITRYTEASVVVIPQSANPQQYTAIGHVLGGASGGTVTLYVAKNGTSGGNGTVYAGGSIVAWKLP